MNKFRNVTKPLMWFIAFILATAVAGCGGGSSETTASAKAIPHTRLLGLQVRPGPLLVQLVEQQ